MYKTFKKYLHYMYWHIVVFESDTNEKKIIRFLVYYILLIK